MYVTSGSGHDAQTATRDLLRRLRQPEKLRTDPVASALLRTDPSAADATYDDRELVARVASQISIALTALHTADPSRPLDERTRRHRSIISRCDLNGEPHKVVAASLGLSMRHFYRERAAAMDRLAASLTAAPAMSVPVELDEIGEFDLHLELLDGLLRRCDLRRASTLAPRLVADATRAAERSAVLVRMSYLNALLGDADGRDRAFRDAAQLAARCDTERERLLLDAELDFVRMVRAWQDAKFGAAAAIGQRLIEVLTIAGRIPERSRQALLRKSLINLGIIQQERGDAARSLETFSLARSVVEHDLASPAEQRLDTLLHSAEARAMVGGDLARSLADTLEVITVARRDGFPKQLVWGLLRAGMLLGFGGDSRAATRHAVLAAQVARGHLDGDWRTVALLRAASVAAAGSPKCALALISEGEACRPSGPRSGGFLPLRRAEVLLADGQVDKAARWARDARYAWESCDSRVMLGQSMLAQGKASVLSGNRLAGSAEITDALALLEGATWLPEYAAARKLRDAIATRPEDDHYVQRAARGFPIARAG